MVHPLIRGRGLQDGVLPVHICLIFDTQNEDVVLQPCSGWIIKVSYLASKVKPKNWKRKISKFKYVLCRHFDQLLYGGISIHY